MTRERASIPVVDRRDSSCSHCGWSEAYAWAANMAGRFLTSPSMSPANAYGFYIGWLQTFSDAGNRGGGGGPRYPRLLRRGCIQRLGLARSVPSVLLALQLESGIDYDLEDDRYLGRSGLERSSRRGCATGNHIRRQGGQFSRCRLESRSLRPSLKVPESAAKN
jgi:hypothetical protein